MNRFFFSIFLIILLPSCQSGVYIRGVDFPTKPIDLTKVTKKGKACYEVLKNYSYSQGNASVREAARNGGINKIYLVQYGVENKLYGNVIEYCTYVYGE